MKNCFLRKLSSTKRAGSRPAPIGSNENNIASSRACGPTAAICLCRRRPPFLEKSLISYNLALCNFLGPELFAGSDGKHEIHKHVLMFSLFCFLSEARPGGKRGGVRKSKDTKNLPSRKNATRRAHKQNICRCAGAPSAQGHGCCIFANLSQKMLRIFCGEAAKLENQCFSTDSTHRKCSGGLLRACWVRSGGALGTFCGAHSPEPAARASLPAGPARITIASLPADRLPLRRSCSQSRSRPGQQAGRPQAELLR